MNQQAVRKEVPGFGTMTEGALINQHHGATGVHNFYKMYAREHPSVLAVNAYVEHLRDNEIGKAIFLPPKDDGSVFNWASGWGPRVINKHEAAPIYFASDWEFLARHSTILLVEGKTNRLPSRALLDRRLELEQMKFDEVCNVARQMGVDVTKGDRKHIVRAVLLREFGDETPFIDRLYPPKK